MVGQGHLHVEDQISRFSSDLIFGVVFAGHHKFSALFPDLFEDAVVATSQKLVGVAALLGLIATASDHTGQFGAGIGWRRQGLGPTGSWSRAVFVKAASGAGMTGHITALLNGEQQHIGIAVVADGLQILEMATGGAFVPKLLA